MSKKFLPTLGLDKQYSPGPNLVATPPLWLCSFRYTNQMFWSRSSAHMRSRWFIFYVNCIHGRHFLFQKSTVVEMNSIWKCVIGLCVLATVGSVPPVPSLASYKKSFSKSFYFSERQQELTNKLLQTTMNSLPGQSFVVSPYTMYTVFLTLYFLNTDQKRDTDLKNFLNIPQEQVR